MNEPIETFKYDHGITASLYYDSDPLNPRKEWDNAATMVCCHRRYTLGDEQFDGDVYELLLRLLRDAYPVAGGARTAAEYDLGFDFSSGEALEPDEGCSDPDFDEDGKVTQERLQECVEALYFIQTLYLYDHGGITIRTSGFSCPWDSGPVGFIYMSKEKARKEWGRALTLEDACKAMDAEVEVYDQYLRGEVYGYVIEDAAGNELDSCWGFFGEKYAKEEMEAAAKWAVEKAQQEEVEREYWQQRGVVTV